MTGTPVAASLGRLQGLDAEATDDLESLFLTVYNILTGGKVFGQHFFLGGNISLMVMARTAVMFHSKLDSINVIREPRSKSFVLELWRLFFPGVGVRYRRAVRAEEVKAVCRKHFPLVLQ